MSFSISAGVCPSRQRVSRKILCIAYDSTLARTRKLLLEHAGYDVVSVIGNQAAMRAAQSNQFDMVVIGHDAGYANRSYMVEWVRNHRPGVPILVLHSDACEQFSTCVFDANAYNAGQWLDTVNRALQ